MKLVPKLAAIALSLAVPASAMAAVATGRMNVRLAILASCEVVSASDLDFGSVSTLSTSIDRSASLTVKCTNTTPYNIGLSSGTNSSSVTGRRMTAGGVDTVSYSLFRDASHTQVWGDTVGTDTEPGQGTGSDQSFTVYGRVNAQSVGAPGNYSDVVTVTITY